MEHGASVTLITPAARVAQRLLREAVRRVAHEQGVSFDTVEDSYTNTRSSLVHLLAHDRSRTAIEDRVEEVLRLGQRFVEGAREMASIPEERLARIEAAAAKVEQCRQELLRYFSVNREAVAQFLQVISHYEEGCLAAGYDPSGIITPNLRKIAQMITANFDAYERTLNT